MAENFDHREKTDEEIVSLIPEDRDNFLYLTERYEDKLLGYIKKISGVSQEEAEDILQEVFLKVYINLYSFDSSLKFSSWIYRITHNQVVSYFRKKKARPQQVFLDADSDFLNNIASEFNIKKELDQKLLERNISKVLAEMDIKYREVLILNFFEGKGYKEISDILKKPMGTVATLIRRAKKQFQEKIHKENINFD